MKKVVHAVGRSNGDEVVCGEKSKSILCCNDAFLKTHRVKRIHPRPCVSQHILHAMLGHRSALERGARRSWQDSTMSLHHAHHQTSPSGYWKALSSRATAISRLPKRISNKHTVLLFVVEVHELVCAAVLGNRRRRVETDVVLRPNMADHTESVEHKHVVFVSDQKHTDRKTVSGHLPSCCHFHLSMHLLREHGNPALKRGRVTLTRRHSAFPDLLLSNSHQFHPNTSWFQLDPHSNHKILCRVAIPTVKKSTTTQQDSK